MKEIEEIENKAKEIQEILKSHGIISSYKCRVGSGYLVIVEMECFNQDGRLGTVKFNGFLDEYEVWFHANIEKYVSPIMNVKLRGSIWGQEEDNTRYDYRRRVAFGLLELAVWEALEDIEFLRTL